MKKLISVVILTLVLLLGLVSVCFAENELDVIYDTTLSEDGSTLELKVTAGDMDGIVSKDDLKIEGGQITVNAPRHGIRGRDFVEISDGDITVTAGKDGIRSNNDKEADRGYISVLGGKIRIICGDDPFDFVTALNIRSAEITTSVQRVQDP